MIRIADTSTPVIILKLFEHLGVGLARSLGRMGVDVYGVNDKLNVPGAYSRYCLKTFQWNLEQEKYEDSVRFLRDLSKKFGRKAILIPTSDHTALFLDDCADQLSDLFIFPRRDATVTNNLSSKKGMYYLCKQHDIPTPEVTFPESRADVEQFIENAAFPVMLKGIDSSRLFMRCGARMVTVHDAADLLRQYDRMEDPADPNLMLQEYIPGGPDTIWMLNAYFDTNSEAHCLAIGRKVRQFPPYVGMTSLGRTEHNDTVEKLTRRFMKEIGYRGVLDLGYRFDARDGQYKLLDVNPRVGATFRLFAQDNGLDVARSLYLDMTGQPIPDSSTHDGRKWVVEENDFFSFPTYHRDGALTYGQWLKSYRGVEECAWFAWDDLVPFARVCMRSTPRLFRWIFKPAKTAATPANDQPVVNTHLPDKVGAHTHGA
jgi:predicted ATP-grasp superfamily ATP-dependent carboligase